MGGEALATVILAGLALTFYVLARYGVIVIMLVAGVLVALRLNKLNERKPCQCELCKRVREGIPKAIKVDDPRIKEYQDFLEDLDRQGH